MQMESSKDATEVTKPMLAGRVEDINLLMYPVACTPKIDGIRCLIRPSIGPVTRNWKPIPNMGLRQLLRDLPPGLDGELVGTGTFQNTTSLVMSEYASGEVLYKVFDYVRMKGGMSLGYVSRTLELRRLNLPTMLESHANRIYVVKLLPVMIDTPQELETYEGECLEAGYEGVMTRVPHGRYKNGRSTWREQLLLKLKRFEESEALVIGFNEKMKNTNEATKDAFGYTERSSHKEGLIPQNTLGSLVVVDLITEVAFSIGSGFDDDTRKKIWLNREEYLNKVCTYKHQPHGADVAPRFPIFKGWRLDL